MKKCRKFAVIAWAFTVLFTGCGQSGMPDTVEKAAILVEKKGGVTYRLVEDFEKEYYDVTELSAMASKEAAAYNGTVTVEKVEALAENEDRVAVEYSFQSTKSFSEFTGSLLFYGTVDEAAAQNYRVEATLNSVTGDIAMTEELLKAHGDSKIVITDAEAVIYCPFAVTHLSEGAVLNEDGSVDASGAEEIVYILLK